MLPVIVVVLISLVFLVFKKYDFWKRLRIPYVYSMPLLGNYGPYILQKEYISTVVEKMCKSNNQKMFGAFYGTEPVLIVQDPEIIRWITTKMFYYFSSREGYQHTDKEFVTKNLFFNYGDKWKVFRQNLSPLFTSSKMKNMYGLIEKCCRKLEIVLDKEVQVSEEIDVLSLTQRFTIDSICACVFGIDTKVLENDHNNNPFTKVGHLIFDKSRFFWFKQSFRCMWPSVFYGLGFKLYPDILMVFFNKLLSNVFNEREISGNSSRQDFIDLFLTLEKKKFLEGTSMKSYISDEVETIKHKVDAEFLAGQCVILFAAGFDTSASTSAFMLYELAKNPECQKRAQGEVDSYMLSHIFLEYDVVTELPYLAQCMDETLRLYPVLGVLMRESTEPCRLPDGTDLPAGLRVHIPVRKIHRDSRYFEDPDIFKPERFSPDQKHNMKPYTYLPFGEGPRLCLGRRFAKMQVLSGVVTVLKKFHVSLAKDMPLELPLEPRHMLTTSAIPIRLKLTPRKS